MSVRYEIESVIGRGYLASCTLYLFHDYCDNKRSFAFDIELKYKGMTCTVA